MQCCICGKGLLSRSVKRQVFTYQGSAITLKQSGLWCDSCEEGVLEGKDVAKTEVEFQIFKEKMDRIAEENSELYFRELTATLGDGKDLKLGQNR